MKSNTQHTIADYSPKGYFVEYPFLMDLAIRKFIDDFQDSFVQKNGKFVLRKRFSKKSLKALLSQYVREDIEKICSTFFLTHPELKNVSFIIADSGCERRTKIALLEQDIDIGIDSIYAVLDEMFNEWMLKKKVPFKGVKIVFCKHKYLLSNDWAKILKKKIFGRSCFFAEEKTMSCLKEEISDESVASFSKRENKVIVSEAEEWIRKELERKN